MVQNPNTNPQPTMEYLLTNVVRTAHIEKLLRLKSLIEKEIVERCMSTRKPKRSNAESEGNQ